MGEALQGRLNAAHAIIADARSARIDIQTMMLSLSAFPRWMRPLVGVALRMTRRMLLWVEAQAKAQIRDEVSNV